MHIKSKSHRFGLKTCVCNHFSNIFPILMSPGSYATVNKKGKRETVNLFLKAGSGKT